jgi:hypothetical protein
MPDIVNPCERCQSYQREFLDYKQMLAEGNYRDAMGGIKSILDRMLMDDFDPELAAMMRSTGACESCENSFSIYDRDGLKKAEDEMRAMISETEVLEAVYGEEALSEEHRILSQEHELAMRLNKLIVTAEQNKAEQSKE